jgi:diguanylate cyclase (GGDEF)-like protein
MGERLNRKFRWFAHRSLRERIGAGLALMVFVVAGLLGGLVSSVSEIQARGRIGQSLAIDAQRLADRLTTEMSARSRELTLLASIDAIRDLPAFAAHSSLPGGAPPFVPALERTQYLLDGLKRSVPAYTWIAIANPAGRVLAATDPASNGTEIATRSPNGEGIRGPGVGNLRDQVEDQRVMDMVQPIREADGTVVGLIAAQLAWNWVRGIERSVVTQDSDGVTRRETFLLNGQDVVVFGPPGMVGLTVPVPSAARARAGFYGWSVEHWPTPMDNPADSFLTGAAFAAGDGRATGPGAQAMRWSVMVREAQLVAFAPATALRHTIWLAGLGIALVFAGVGWLLGGMVTAPLAKIAAAAERLRQGDDVEIPRIRGPAEIESLAASLRALVATLTRKQLALDDMEELALHDPLTGLLNRHGLRLKLEAAVAQAQERQTSLMLFVADLDGFKAVNDTLGHATGDMLLCHVASRLTQALRADDLVARIGGDEFVLALQAPGGADDSTAMAVARRAQQAIQQPYSLAGHNVRIGCSLGGACWPEHAGSGAETVSISAEMDAVIAHADTELYAVKRSGKGRVRLHGALTRLP